jgi:hypothetical protein
MTEASAEHPPYIGQQRKVEFPNGVGQGTTTRAD